MTPDPPPAPPCRVCGGAGVLRSLARIRQPSAPGRIVTNASVIERPCPVCRPAPAPLEPKEDAR